MPRKIYTNLLSFLLFPFFCNAQNYNFNFNTNGRRVCLVSSEINSTNSNVKIIIHDAAFNTTEPIYIYRRAFGTYVWTNVASALPPNTTEWIDNSVFPGQIWEYQIRRLNTWNFNALNYDAIGYTIGSLLNDNTNYKGQIILLVSDDIPTNLAAKYFRLKKDLTADGWFVNELIVPRATNWDSGSEVVTIKNQVITIYNNASLGDKPKAIFILGHVPLPRSGSTNITTPDEHDENKGARGCDSYYADIDGIYTDIATYDPGGLSTPLAINLPDDFKWDQDIFPSNIEMAFGRVDFADITDVATPELTLIENYLDKLSSYKNVTLGFNMGDKTAFNFGYDNSNDGSYRSLINISTPNNLFQSTVGANPNLWVQNNGPFKIYMQNINVPQISDWQNYGMNATVFSSDQSYWGFGDQPQTTGSLYSRIRALLAVPSKCLVTLWTTTGINIFHQACTGMPLGIATKEIMNHNTSNQILEKAPQTYDTEDWWNRTHFAYYGDPTLNLYQISPATNLTLVNSGANAILQWTNSADAAVVGYHIYKSTTEFGKFERISTSINTTNNYSIPNYQSGAWYMVKAIKVITSGCGKFLHSSLGISMQVNIVLPVTLIRFNIMGNTKEGTNLAWATATELHTKNFEVQTSKNTISDWETLGTINAAGNSSQEKQYSFLDRISSQQLHYYRLKINDFDGRFEYSKILSCKNNQAENQSNPYVSINKINQTINLFIPESFNGNSSIIKINIFDRNGKRLFQKIIPKGSNLLQIDVNNWVTGLYFYEVLMSNTIKTYTGKFVY